MKPFVKEHKITSAESESFKQYLMEISKMPLLSIEEELEYAMRAKDGDEVAFRILIESNLRFVVSVAKQSVDRFNKLEDLINEGNLGLIKAGRRYDPTRGFKFISYAVWWIRQKINEYKNENSRLIRLPGNKISQVNKLKTAMNTLEQNLDREPSTIEIAEYMEIDANIVNHILELQKSNVNSLDKPMDEDGYSLLEVIPINDNSNTDNKLNTNDKNQLVKNLLGSLKPREELIIRLCYGLGEHKEMTLNDIGDMVGVSREAIRQIRDKTLKKLKVAITNSDIDFVDILQVGK